MKQILSIDPLNQLKAWPTGFQHTVIAMLSAFFLFVFWHWNPIEAQLNSTRLANSALKRTIKESAILMPPSSLNPSQSSVQPISLLQHLLSANQISILLIKPSDSKQFNIHASAHYTQLRQLIGDLNRSTLTWHINSLTLLKTDLGTIDIQIALQALSPAH